MTLDTAFTVEPLEDSDDALVTCPKCTHGVIVHLPTWVTGAGAAKNGPARPCTYCCRSHMVPTPEEYIRYPIVLKFEGKNGKGKGVIVADNAEQEADAYAEAVKNTWVLVSKEPMLK